MKFLGTFNVESGSLWIADPGYDKIEGDDDGVLHLKNVVKGLWKGFVTLTRGGQIESLNAFGVRSDFVKETVTFECAVDGGQLGIFDYDKFPVDSSERETLLEKINKVTETDKMSGIIEDFGVCSQTCYGDGRYKVFVDLNDEGEAQEIQVFFVDGEERDRDW